MIEIEFTPEEMKALDYEQYHHPTHAFGVEWKLFG